MSADDTLTRLAGAAAELLEPLAAAARLQPRPYGLRLFLAEHAIDLDDFAPEDGALREFATRVDVEFTALTALSEGGADVSADPLAVLEAASVLIETIETLADLATRVPEEVGVDIEGLARAVVDALVVEYLADHHGALTDLLVLLDVISLPDPHAGRRARFSPERLREWLAAPGETARAVYGFGTPAFASETLFVRLAPVLSALGLPAMLEAAPSSTRLALEGHAPEDAPPLPADQIRVPLARFASAGPGALAGELGLLALPLRASADGASDAGVAIVPYGHGTTPLARDVADGVRVSFDDHAGSDAPFGLLVRPEGVELAGLADEPAPGAVDMSFALTRTRASGPASTFFAADGLGAVEVDATALRLDLRAGAAGDDARVALPVRGRLRVSPPAGDGLLDALLPEGGVETPFEVELGWSRASGPYLGAAGALEITLPVTRSAFGGSLNVDSVTFGLGIEDGRLALTVALNACAVLGPFRATLDRVGLEIALAFSGDDDDTRPVRLESRFKAPAGVALSLDSSGLAGGGYLAHDAERGEYAGLVQLRFGTLLLVGAGILNTRRPDGRPGFSLALLITGEFPPVQLGFGFTLNGVGGLLGVNRAADAEALRDGVREGRLGALLFAERALGNAPRIVSELGRFFPQSDGTHLFGPMVKIGWGPVPIIAAEIGVVLEFPDPLRMLLLGRLRLGLPSLEKAIARINMDLLGVIDFEAGTLAIDASLVDSSIAGYRLEGDAALRARWLGDDPDFALAIGGFHPGATPPAGFPALRRIGIDLSRSASRRLRLESYFALTANSVQCGARVDAFAKEGIFSAEAFLSFDTLFRFEPFRFAVTVRGAAVIRMRGRAVLGVELALALSGPGPWRAAGYVRFTIARVSSRIPFDLTVGDEPERVPVRPVELRALLLEELERPSVWSGATAPAGGSAVTLRDTRGDADTTPLVHPQGRLGVRQTLVPLGEPITRYGERPVPEAERGFRIARMTLGKRDPTPGSDDAARTVATDVLTDRFAPAQYVELSDAERLASPAYAEYASGVAATPELAAIGDRLTLRPDYETVTIDTTRGVREVGRYTLPDGALVESHRRGAAARAARRRRGSVAYPGPKRTLRLRARAGA